MDNNTATARLQPEASAHPITVALALGLVVIEALVPLLTAVAALLLTVLGAGGEGSSRVSAPAGSPAAGGAAAPAIHPLAVIAQELQACTLAELRPMVHRPGRAKKTELVSMICAC